MKMEPLNIRIDSKTLKEIDAKLPKHRYATRTEFVREAIRRRLTDLEKEELLKHLDSVAGAFKHKKTTDEQLHKMREKVFEELDRELKDKKPA